MNKRSSTGDKICDKRQDFTFIVDLHNPIAPNMLGRTYENHHSLFTLVHFSVYLILFISGRVKIQKFSSDSSKEPNTVRICGSETSRW